jgi:abortive infection bacteriophage resistance protein
MPVATKTHQTYGEQVALLRSRGMDVGPHETAVDTLRRVNYYRLSGYWYPFRRARPHRPGEPPHRADDFVEGTRLAEVVALYDFDARLRAATFSVLAPVELTVRALLGHELGRVHPCAHLEPGRLGPRARSGQIYQRWRDGYERELRQSREDFVAHHRERYGGLLPVWAAVELLDWGGLTHLFGFAPRAAQDAVAGACGLTAPQLESWLKSLNIVRNICAHHGRLFNRVHAIQPKLPRRGTHPTLDSATTSWNRTFGQLTLIQFLLDRLQLGRGGLLPAVIDGFPDVSGVPLSHVGADITWRRSSALWGR